MEPMILEKPYELNDVITIKLTSGEELIARYQSKTDTEIKVTKPLMLMASQQGVGLVPFMHTVSLDSKLGINKNSVVVMAKTDKEIASQYMQQTTGLATNVAGV